jgi:DNA-binding transcriptional regulator YiaG
MSKRYISAAERELIKAAAEYGVEIVDLGNGSTFKFTPAKGNSDPYGSGPGEPSKCPSVSFARKPHMRGIKSWQPPRLAGDRQYGLAMAGDSHELTDARASYAMGNPGPLREWLAANRRCKVNPDTFKQIRIRAGLTQSQLAERLRISDKRTIRYWESGERAISGPVTILMEQLERGELH